MIYNLNSIRKQILGLSLAEARFKERGFEEGSEAQNRLELVATTVVQGYNTAVEHGLGRDIKDIATSVKKELVGFYSEGLAMGLYTLDIFSLSKKDRLFDFIKDNNYRHEYMSYIGAGLAAGVFKRPYEKFMDKACPLTGCLILDGIGFYYAMFKTKKTIEGKYVPAKVLKNEYHLKRYDNGIGRAVWFYDGGEPDKISNTINSFPEERRASIWSGVGLAALYAGGVSAHKLEKLKLYAGAFSPFLGQGAFLAAHTRFRAGNPHEVDIAAPILIGKSSKECHDIAMVFHEELKNVKSIDGKPSFQVMTEKIRAWIKTNESILSNIKKSITV